MQFKNEVIFTGHLLPEELRKIIGAAFCLVYVSIFEGFGIPIVESMSCRVPVITSNITSMPEVAGDACLLVNPLHPHEISKAMQKMVEDDIFRQACIENGSRQALKFNWNETTQKLWAAMMQILQAAA
jgi:glycosyltransferase involved in cell wall biosynthesis